MTHRWLTAQHIRDEQGRFTGRYALSFNVPSIPSTITKIPTGLWLGWLVALAAGIIAGS